MTSIVNWAASRARMVLAFIVLSIAVGSVAYISLPKEGEPDIEIPTLVISVPFPGISASDSETLLVQPMESQLSDLDGLEKITATAAEGYANIVLEFRFGWDKTKVMADVRDAMDSAKADFPSGYEQYTLDEFNFSEFPIIIVNLTGPLPERTISRVAKELQDEIESLEAVLEASIVGSRDEMVEVIIDPLRLEAYNVTASELVSVVQDNNQLIAAGEVKTDQGTFAVKIPSSFDEISDIYSLPVKINGDRIVTLGDLATINLTFEDKLSTARFDGIDTVALQVVKRKGFNLIDTATAVKTLVTQRSSAWPDGLKAAVQVGTSNDQSRVVDSMVKQLQNSVFTAIALVMLVSLAALGPRASLLVGFAIPTSFLLCFVLLAIMGISISNIVMFGLILSVGMLVDGAIVVVEYADKRQQQGVGPMQSYVDAANRMFWPIVSSTATTLCAFLPMLFWPGVPGQFMGMLPVTLIFVLSASLIVALVYLPVMGGVLGRIMNWFSDQNTHIAHLPFLAHLLLFPLAALLVCSTIAISPLQTNISVGFATMDQQNILRSVLPAFLTVFANIIGIMALVGLALSGLAAGVLSTTAIFLRLGLVSIWAGQKIYGKRPSHVSSGYHQSSFGILIKALVGNPLMPVIMLGAVFAFVGTTLIYYINNNNGVEFFVETEPEEAIVYVLARGNLSLNEKDTLLRQAEKIIINHPSISSVFSFAGNGGLNANTGGATSPKDTIGQIQIETIPWETRPDANQTWFTIPLINYKVMRKVKADRFDGEVIMDELASELAKIPGIRSEVFILSRGPVSGKPVHLRITGYNWSDLVAATALARAKFDDTLGLIAIEDTRPLPGIDWQIDVDVEKAGRYGANVATVGAMVQLVTRGLLLDTMRVDSSDEEVEIRVRLPEQDRVLSTLDTLKIRTTGGLVPLANFITRTPVASLAEINRVDQFRYFDIKADVISGLQKLVKTNTIGGVDTEEIVATLRPSSSGEITLDKKTFYTDLRNKSNQDESDLSAQLASGELRMVPVNPNERISELSKWIETNPFPSGLGTVWTGDQEDQAESGAFLQKAFAGALGLMFIILLAQFNSVYNALLVLLAVILSTAGVLIGMLVMDQPFSIIMTGTGIVALAGIVVNNNIVLIDTYQEYEKYMPRVEAIIRTAQDRIRPVILTTITTMAGLTPMMFGLSLDFSGGGYTVDSPTALWWKQLATAVVFGLGIATFLTLMVTPSLLAMRIWVVTYARWTSQLLAKLSLGRASSAARDWALVREASHVLNTEIIWDFHSEVKPEENSKKELTAASTPLKAAE